jgi:CMP-N-acetylneuraminic acid synthetase
MIDNKRVIALIPAKKKSHRIPNKNLKNFGKRPLVEHKILQLKKSKIIDEIILGTNSKKIIDIAKKNKVSFFVREESYCGTLDTKDKNTANDMIKNLASTTDDKSIIIWVHCTNPLIDHKIYDEALITFVKKNKLGFDSLASVDLIKQHVFDKNFKAINYNPYAKRHKLADEIDYYYSLNGGFFIQLSKNMKKNNYFFGKKPFMYVTPEIFSVDLNTPQDFSRAINIYNALKKSKKS